MTVALNFVCAQKKASGNYSFYRKARAPLQIAIQENFYVSATDNYKQFCKKILPLMQPVIDRLGCFRTCVLPAKEFILLVRSSSFTKWKDVEEYLSYYNIINRGFGGSSLLVVSRYANEIIVPYHPKQTIVYCGENNFSYNEALISDTLVLQFQKLFNLIRCKMLKVPIAYVSMKPGCKHLAGKMIEANKAIQNFLATKKCTAYSNVYDATLWPNGYSNGILFNKGSLHKNVTAHRIGK